MFTKFSVLLFIIKLIHGFQTPNQQWDLAVAVSDQIVLLQSDGTFMDKSSQEFSKLKALAFDNIRHQFIVSDMDKLNDTIFTVELNEKSYRTPILRDLPDDIKGLAIDPISDTLFWTDSKNNTINAISLNDSEARSEIVLTFNDEKPQDLAVDVCNRNIYWTNANFLRPTIERSRLDGTDRTTIIDTDIQNPIGISIDYEKQRIYWADRGEGIDFRIESANLNGKERQIVFEGTHIRPFAVAVDAYAIYWTDLNSNALWRIEKINLNSYPQNIRNFTEIPRGIVARNKQIASMPVCKDLADAIEKYNESLEQIQFNENEKERFVEESAEIMENTQEIDGCLNGGELFNNSCKCKRGFSGEYCEISMCHNYCMHGYCYMSSTGYPMCRCKGSFSGNRCEYDICDGYCLNDGTCKVNSHGKPECRCSEHYMGGRCEINISFNNLCALFCDTANGDSIVSADSELTCRCMEGSFIIYKSNTTSAQFISQEQRSNFQMDMNKFQDPVFLLQTVLLILSIMIIVCLLIYVIKVRKLRPRIKKRIIVNKNITPLTYRPQPTTEQCEITIENCCNMNVCETPCFEPPTLRNCPKPDDKKKLLANMENGEDLY